MYLLFPKLLLVFAGYSHIWVISLKLLMVCFAYALASGLCAIQFNANIFFLTVLVLFCCCICIYILIPLSCVIVNSSEREENFKAEVVKKGPTVYFYILTHAGLGLIQVVQLKLIRSTNFKLFTQARFSHKIS